MAQLLPAGGDLTELALPRRLAATFTGHTGSVLVVRSNSTGTYCLSGSKDRTVRLWNLSQGTHVTTFKGHGGDVRGLEVFSDNSKFVSGGGDRVVATWDVASSRIIRRFTGHTAIVNDVALAASESLVVSASVDKSVSFWDLRARGGRAIQSVNVAQDTVSSVRVTDGPYVFAGSIDGSVTTLDLRRGSLVRDSLHEAVTGIAAAADGSFFIAACMDNTVRLLDRSSGDVLASYRGHKHAEFALECALLGDDALVAAGSEDGHFIVWDLGTKEVRLRLSAHNGVVSTLGNVPNSGGMLTGGADGVIKYWQPLLAA